MDHRRTRMMGIAGAAVVAALVWGFASSSREEAKQDASSPREREKVSRREEGGRREAAVRLWAILEGKEVLPEKFASVEALVESLDDRELAELLESAVLNSSEPYYQGDRSRPETWVFCALWSEKGRRAASVEECPRLLERVENLADDKAKLAEVRKLEAAVSCFLRGYGSREPVKAWEHYLAQESWQLGDMHDFRNWAITTIFGSWAKRDPEAAYEEVMRIANVAGPGYKAVEGFYREVDPALIPAFLEKMTPEGYGVSPLRLQGVIAGHWALTAPDDALAWLQTQWERKEPEHRETGTDYFLSTWMAEDVKGMASWCAGEGKAAMEVLGKEPFGYLFMSSPALAARFVEAGWPGEDLKEIDELIDAKRGMRMIPNLRRSEKSGDSYARAPWHDYRPLLEDWTREFEVVAPRLGIPEEKRREWVEKLRKAE